MPSLSLDDLLDDIPRPWFEPVEGEQEEFYREMGYSMVCKMNGKIVGLYPFIFTVAIVVGMDETGYEYRFCYSKASEAAASLLNWILIGGDEPAGYIKRK